MRAISALKIRSSESTSLTQRRRERLRKRRTIKKDRELPPWKLLRKKWRKRKIAQRRVSPSTAKN